MRAALFLGAGIDDADLHWADPELRRWTAILAAAREAGSSTGRDLGVRALTLRGIPQASARAAVTEAANNLQGDQPIWVSSHTVAVGECPQDAIATTEIVVRGGPGTATPASDSITVEPTTFGPEETTLHIELEPAPAGSVTWNTIALESITDRVVLDVTARWCETHPDDRTDQQAMASDDALAALRARLSGAPVQTGPSSALRPPIPATAVLVVASTGQADYHNINAAINAAPDYAQIRVRPGTYREGLVLDKPLQIIGDGPVDEIVIEATTADCIWLRAEESWVSGLTLRGRSGSEQRNFYGVEISEGKSILEDCDITSDSLSCVAIHGSGTMAILRRCHIHDGKAAGIFIYEESKGTFTGCDIHSNAAAGVYVSEGGDPTIQDCHIHDGQVEGVFVCQHGRGTVTGCDIHSNTYSNVIVTSGGDPTIQDCDIHDAGEGGIYVHEQGRGMVIGCNIHSNTLAGITIGSGGEPIIHDCHIHDGQEGGIYVHDQGRATVENCRIVANSGAGVHVKTAYVALRNNIIRSNSFEAIWAEDHGVVKQHKGNDLTGNARGPWDVDNTSSRI